jgi:hypothetical protein
MMIVLRARSHFVSETWVCSYCSEARTLLPGGKCYCVTSDHGELALTYLKLELSADQQVDFGTSVQGRKWYFDHTRESSVDLSLAPSELAPQGGWRHLGFGYESYSEAALSGAFAIRLILLPDWFVAGAFAAIPSLWMLNWQRTRRRAHAGRCVVCGYDLRASPGRCPECGTELPCTPSEGKPS